MNKEQLLSELKTKLHQQEISETEILSLLAGQKCHFCQNLVPKEKHYQLSF
ncbi:MAG: hypothetical protein NY202_03310 [Mollicutes bacterium UO1]